MLRLATLAGTALLLTLPVVAQQQDSSAPTQQQSSSQDQQNQNQQNQNQQNQNQQNQNQQKKPEKKKSTAEANPFPEDQSQKAADQENQQQDPGVPSAPQPSAQKDQGAKKPSAAEANPFPEEKSDKAQQGQSDQPSQDDQNYSSSQVHLKGMDLAPTGGDEDTAPIQASSPLPYDPKLAKKDAQIGDYYLETGDIKGAYDRFVEAARSDPGNAEAVWGLGESAHRLQMNDVAIRNYRLYLAALPNGPHAKAIRKQLKDMGLEPGS